MNLTLKIDQVDAATMTRERFRREYLSNFKPLILKGFAKLFPAGRLWTFDYLNEKMGEHVIGVLDNRIKKILPIQLLILK